VPKDVDSKDLVKAWGVVELPLHVRWSDPAMRYDLGKRADRLRVYEQVLREGTDEDVRYFIDVRELLELWDELVIPQVVRRSWAAWFRDNRSLELAC
jgi:hypothetical protein